MRSQRTTGLPARLGVRFGLGLIVLLLPLLAAADASAEVARVRRYTIEELATRAAEGGLAVVDARSEVEGAQAARRAARTLYGPRLVVEGRALYFNERPTAELDFQTGEVPEAYRQLVDGLLPSGPMEVGEPYSVEARATLAQPLSKLGAIRELATIKRLGVDVAEAHLDGARAVAALEAREAAYQLLSLRASVAALDESAVELEARLAQVRAFATAELVGPEEVLEVEVRLAELRQGQVKARAFERVASARLAVAARLERDQPFEVEEPAELPPLPRLEECLEQAGSGRAELNELRALERQAQAGVRARAQQILPEVNLVGIAQYQAGSAFGTPALAAGLVLSWTPLDWGQAAFELREARSQVRRAEVGLERAAELIGLDVERAWAEADSAREALSLAATRRARADELYRLERVRFESNDSTSADLLGAQTALLRARTDEATGRYDYLIALSALRRAMGEWR